MKIYQRFLFGAVVVLFSILLTLYTSYGVWWEIYRRVGIIYVVMTFLLLQFFKSPSGLIGKVQTYMVNGIFILTISQLLFTVFLLIQDGIRVVFESEIDGLTTAGLVVTGCFLLLCVYGTIWWKYRYTIHKHSLTIPGLPKSFDGIKIVQISDIHSGSFDNIDAVKRWVALINEQNPDLFFFTWDLVNNQAEEFAKWKNIFARIQAKIGKYSILGNHDYGDYALWNSQKEKEENHTSLKDYHRQIWWNLLLNSHARVHRWKDSIVIAGVENWWEWFMRYGDIDKALEGIEKNECIIMLSHDPTHWEMIIKKHKTHIALTLSWHTHGMQIWIDMPWFKRSPIKLRYKKRLDLYYENGKYLYVNRGFGFLGLSARVGIWPEITVITLFSD